MTVSRLTDQKYLLSDQYHNANKLHGRLQLHDRFSTNKYGFHRWAFDQLKIPARGHVLDLGCGPGLLWSRNWERVPMDWDITLADFSTGMVREVRGNLGTDGRRFAFAAGDAQALPFADHTFDAVIANHMFYHVPDRPRAYVEVARVLKEDGVLYAATNGKVEGASLGDWVRKVDPNTSVAEPIEGKKPSFTLETGERELAGMFTQISLYRYEDSLRVTDVEALVAYVSTSSNCPDAEGLKRFREIVATEIADNGAIHLAKSQGIFEAFK